MTDTPKITLNHDALVHAATAAELTRAIAALLPAGTPAERQLAGATIAAALVATAFDRQGDMRDLVERPR